MVYLKGNNFYMKFITPSILNYNAGIAYLLLDT